MHLEDDLAQAADACLVGAYQLGSPAMALGVALVHPKELGGEQGRLLAAGSGPDLDDHVLVVVRIARQEQHTQLFDQRGLRVLGGLDLCARQVAQLGIRFGLSGAHLACSRAARNWR